MRSLSSSSVHGRLVGHRLSYYWHTRLITGTRVESWLSSVKRRPEPLAKDWPSPNAGKPHSHAPRTSTRPEPLQSTPLLKHARPAALQSLISPVVIRLASRNSCPKLAILLTAPSHPKSCLPPIVPHLPVTRGCQQGHTYLTTSGLLPRPPHLS
ncbi:hypothetical protein EJ02DRAFT_20387 [Clathrospora elynae]|uniref:Uncharacterized protein n=1 Tax=Clathrospora elynae TaxID=706981 RepID=A0A6A5SG07_9PLEO|nr:hypothetical protein EJ02DRAFT_20387 [Clathrospora elynae]